VTSAEVVERRGAGTWALTRREVLAAAVLAGMVACGAKLAFDAAAMPSKVLVFSLSSRGFPGWLSGPFHGLGSHLTWGGFYAALIGLCALWAGSLRLSAHIRLRWALVAVAALHALMALAPPIGMSDAFNYVGIGRVAVEHGLNPYVDRLVQVPHDPAFFYASWPDWPNPYGPLATLLFCPLGLTGVPQGLWLVKLGAAAASLGLVALVAACARELGRDPVPAVLLVGLNPVLLVYGVAGAHLDLVMVGLGMAGVLLVLRRREPAAGGLVAAGAAVKVTGALLLPFALAGARRRRALVAGAAAGGAGLAAVAVALWGPHLFAGLADQREVASPRSVPGLLARAFGAPAPPPAVAVAAGLGFTAAYLALVRAAWRGMDWIAAAGWATVAALLAVTWLMPWYVVWVLPLAALGGSSRLRLAAVGLTFFVLFVRLIPLS
jgi:hypothetical protein